MAEVSTSSERAMERCEALALVWFLCSAHCALCLPVVNMLFQLRIDSARCRVEAVCARPRYDQSNDLSLRIFLASRYHSGINDLSL